MVAWENRPTYHLEWLLFASKRLVSGGGGVENEIVVFCRELSPRLIFLVAC